ncbi:nitrate/nitrite transporter [uncultured Schumannella sp.]|uniref:MFS transporter n=1 Tax=uncultured Schumannella sp. TaxID=1195956 RepID=UPI0025D8120E|nr:MFS transporter [uncultured Schumannella sp.]
MNSWRSWVVFTGAVTVYLIAVTQRTTFGIVGVEATERFGVSAATLSMVAVVQIATYASLQIPVGVLVDRLGPRILLIAGAGVMGLGQLLLAFADDIGLAIAARMLVGAGDAFTFVSVIRLLPNWFSGRILPQLAQWVGMIGGTGQLVSAIPFAFLLHAVGWNSAFVIAAGASVFAVLLGVTVIRTGTRPPFTEEITTASTWSRLRTSIARPGTQLGFWSHLLGGTAPQTMGVLWGYPFLTAGLGYDVPTAAGVFSLLVVGAVLPAPLIGYAIASYPFRRGDLVLGMAALVYAAWAVVLLWPGQPPLAVVCVVFFLIGAGGPSSLIGMDYARTFNPSHSVGTASGFVNVGGFLGGFVSMFLIGVVLDVVDSVRVSSGLASDLYAFDAFRLALLAPFAIALVGVIGVIVTRRRARTVMARDEGIEITPLWVALFRSRRNRPDRPPLA